MKMLPFEAVGYRFEDIQNLQGKEKIEAIGELIRGLKKVTPEVRCRKHPLQKEAMLERSERYELTFEESQGDIPPINLALFDLQSSDRKIVGIYSLYGIRVVLQTQDGAIIRARPWPAFNDLGGKEWAILGLDIAEWFLDNDFTSEDGRVFFLEGLDFSIYCLPEGAPGRTDADARMEWVNKEYARRKRRNKNPLRGSEKWDSLGRKIVMLDRPHLIHNPHHSGS